VLNLTAKSWHRLGSFLFVPAFIVGLVLFYAAPVHADTLRLSGSSWLGGQGVDVKGDGDGSWNYVNGVQSGFKWQCVELINRLYLTKGWISARWTGNGNQLYANAPSGLVKQPNGSITNLKPGDVVAMDDGGFGHAAIVNSISGSTVQVVNQNTQSVYSTATLSNGTLSRFLSNYEVQGVIHAPGGGSGGGSSAAFNNDIFQATGTGWRVSYNGATAWDALRDSETLASTLAIGDFDEDGHEDDIFQATGIDGIGWRVSMNGTGSWQSLRNSTTTMDTLKLGDFDGDGHKSDVFQATGDTSIGWRYVSDGNTNWQSLRVSGATAENLAIGDFDHDGHEDDVFYATGSNWLVSMNGTGSWQTLRASGTTMDTLKLGDFDGDGYKDDVFQATGIAGVGWRVSHDGKGSWVSLLNSTTAANTLAIGDFDEDGHEDDVFQASGVYGVGWRVSYNGTSSWNPLVDSGTTMDTLRVGDFN
jgi:hypothetical protein